MTAPLPLAGIRVLEYAQYVAGPFAGMLLADLGADVIKVEPPAGDAWRRYDPFAEGESRYFYALNRNKRSVVLDLKQERGRMASRALIRTAGALLHNLPAERALRFGLDREAVSAVNPDAVWCCVSAFGSDGPEAGLTGFDLIAQALSGLLAAGARPSDAVPQRAGGIAMADFTAGLLAAVAVLAGLVGGEGRGVEVSLLGAALAVQAQRFVSVDRVDRDASGPASPRPASDDLEPYYRAYLASDGILALACLHERQRRAAASVVGLEDPWVVNPQAPPASQDELTRRLALIGAFEGRIAAEPVVAWVARFRAAGVPASEVRRLEQLFEHEQARANGLVHTLERAGVGPVTLLGSLFKIDGVATPPARGVPSLGEHTEELLSECLQA